MDRVYSSPYWMTYKQATEKGGNVRKGEKSSLVVFWKMLDRNNVADVSEGADSVSGKLPLLRYYNLFNLEQCEGIESPKDSGCTVICNDCGEKIYRLIYSNLKTSINPAIYRTFMQTR